MALLGGFIAVLFVASQASGWGGIFNRFSPETLSNLGYGGRGGGIGPYAHNAYEEGPNEVEPPQPLGSCDDLRCASNENCCPGQICFSDYQHDEGKCEFVARHRAGEICAHDRDCDAGLLCEEVGPGEPHICTWPRPGRKQYNEDCVTSSECDIVRGLCCALQRRHRQKPRKSCAYFKDPLVCIGPVASDQIRTFVEHTAGEKRLGYSHMG